MKTIRQQFKERVIELIHGIPYKKSGVFTTSKLGLPITLGSVMSALKEEDLSMVANDDDIGNEEFHFNIYDKKLELTFVISWKLLNEDKTECTDDDQSDETIKAIYNLIL